MKGDRANFSCGAPFSSRRLTSLPPPAAITAGSEAMGVKPGTVGTVVVEVVSVVVVVVVEVVNVKKMVSISTEPPLSVIVDVKISVLVAGVVVTVVLIVDVTVLVWVGGVIVVVGVDVTVRVRVS